MTDLEETLVAAKDITKDLIGARCKIKDNYVLIYANIWTLLVDLYKLAKLKINNLCKIFK